MIKKIVEMVMRKIVKRVVWKIVGWWMYWQINEEQDQIINRWDCHLEVSDDQIRMAVSVWEGFVWLNDYCGDEVSKEYWKVHEEIWVLLDRLDEREKMVVVGSVMDDMLGGVWNEMMRDT